MLRMLAQVPTRLGHFGSIGNHELFMGLDVVRRAYDRAPVQLLEEESVRLGAYAWRPSAIQPEDAVRDCRWKMSRRSSTKPCASARRAKRPRPSCLRITRIPSLRLAAAASR